MKTPKQKPMKAFAVRADEAKMKEAAVLGIEPGDLFRRALDSEISKRKKVCVSCGRLKLK